MLLLATRRNEWGIARRCRNPRVQVARTRLRLPMSRVIVDAGRHRTYIFRTSSLVITIKILSKEIESLPEMQERVRTTAIWSFSVAPFGMLFDPDAAPKALAFAQPKACMKRRRTADGITELRRYPSPRSPSSRRVYDESRMPQEPSRRPGRRAYFLIGLFALALVLFPFLFWYSTWFGRALSDAEMDRYFADREKPRHIQHALVQLGERMSHGTERRPLVCQRRRGRPAARAWRFARPRRGSWGRTTTRRPFTRLLKMLGDPEPMVRRNAALGARQLRRRRRRGPS